MQMDVDEPVVGITRIVLSGDLDARGSGEIDVQFSAVAASRPKVVVDLTQVAFLASIGIRTLMLAAKANNRKGGKLVLLDPSDAVHKVLRTSGADTVLPVVRGLDSALAAVA